MNSPPITRRSDVIQVLASRALQRCDQLAQQSDDPERLTRTFCSPAMLAVHSLVTGWMLQAGMTCRTDAIGNLIGRREGTQQSNRTFIIGSHLDTVPDAGRYDGVLGVLLGLAVVEALSEHGFQLPFALEVIAFSEEEGIRYQSPFLGSRAVAGCFDQELLKRRDSDGVEMAEAIRRFGQSPASIPAAAYRPNQMLGFLEAHIEQGPVLESEGLPVAVVEAITGMTRASIHFNGEAGHAGTIPMLKRRDALVGAARWIAEVETIGRETQELVATVGQLEVSPSAPNVIPGRVDLSLDVRHRKDSLREFSVEKVLQAGERIAAERGLRFAVSDREDHVTVNTDPSLNRVLDECVADGGLTQRRLTSGAGHDAEIMARLTPTTMLFLRCAGGISHHPRESVLPSDVEAALQVMVRFVEKLATKQLQPSMSNGTMD